MKISEYWLRELVQVDVDSAQLADRLTMAGLEVDGIEPCAAAMDGVVVGTVLAREQHPNADRLSVCQVDIGGPEPLQIVCGAPNVRAGGRYPVATIGTTLPGGLKIKRSKLRGVESCGMLCSANELGLAATVDGLLELDAAAVPGESLRHSLGLDDCILDINITPNRADCFSAIGLARDIAAVAEAPLCLPEVPVIGPGSAEQYPPVLDAPAAAPVFVTRVIDGLDPAAVTPLWLAERLRRSGIRPLHPVVDITNYVMLELGQPMHAYDRDRLQGDQLTARFARSGEKLAALDGTELALDTDVLVIADAAGPVAMAGVIGGAGSAVHAGTTRVVLESAYFQPQTVAGRARRFGLHTESALRFERGVDFSGQQRAIERATALLLSITGGRAGPVVAARADGYLPERTPVELRAARLERVLGLGVPAVQVSAMLARLGFAVQSTADGWWVTPPPARFDIGIEADLIEEVARLYGYDQVPAAGYAGVMALGRASETAVPLARLRDMLTARGFQEVITYSFVAAGSQSKLLGGGDGLALSNPLSADLAEMRLSLWPGLLHTWQLNHSRQQDRLQIFECGVTFGQQDNVIKEKTSLAGLLQGPRRPAHWDDRAGAADADFFDLKSALESVFRLAGNCSDFTWHAAEHPALRPGCTARIERGGQHLGWIGELHPQWVRQYDAGSAPVLFELDVAVLVPAALPTARAVSRFPSVRRDIAVVVAESVTAGELIEAVRGAAGERLVDIMVFDVYRGDKIESGLKSVALGLILQETSRTLTEPEIDRTVAAVKEKISGQFNASIRE